MKKRSRFSWGDFLCGLLLTAAGVFTLVRPQSTLTGLVVLYGLLAVLLGIGDIVVYVQLSRVTGFGPMLSLLSGILSVMCGLLLVANPDLGKWALTLLLPVWFLAHSISGLTHTGLLRRIETPFYYAFTLAVNIIGLVLGVLLLCSPALSFLTLQKLSQLAAVCLIVFGGEALVEAFTRRDAFRL